MGCSKANAGTTQWQGLCIPSERIINVQGGFWGKLFKRAHVDESVAPTILLDFSAQELAQAIPGYVPEIPGHVGTIMGSTVTLQPLPEAARVGGPAHLRSYNDLWKLKGVWRNSSIEKIPSMDLYRVFAPEDKKYRDYFALLKVDLRRVDNTPIPPLNNWYVASCGQAYGVGYSCERGLITEDFYLQYTLAKPNLTKLAALDAFFENQLKLWREDCAAQ